MEKLQLFIDSWDFFREAALSGLFAGALLGALGSYILLGRMVFMSAALSQVSSAGVAASYWILAIFGVHTHATFLPATFSIILSLIVFGAMARPLHTSKTPDAILAAVYLAGASATVLICTQIVHEIQDVQQLLTGNAVLVEHQDFMQLCFMAPLVLAIFMYAHRTLEAAMFWNDSARVAHIPVNIVRLIIQCILVIAIASTTRMMGALPVFALSCLPALAAKPATTFRRMFIYAMLIGAACGFGGYVLAFIADFPVGPSQTAMAVICACLSWAISRILRILKTI